MVRTTSPQHVLHFDARYRVVSGSHQLAIATGSGAKYVTTENCWLWEAFWRGFAVAMTVRVIRREVVEYTLI